MDNEENKISENKEEEKKEENYNINNILEEQNPVIDINSQEPIADNTLVNNILKDVDTSQTILLNKKENDTTISEINQKTGIQRDKMVENILKNVDTNENQSTEIFKLSNQLKEKESLILQLKKKLNKYYREDYNSTKELIICEPDHVNIEMNNELCETREK